MTTLTLPEYAIHIGPAAPALEAWLDQQRFSRLLVLADPNTQRHCLPLLAPVLEPLPHDRIEVPAGERYKTIDTCRAIWQRMLDLRLDRRCLVLNLGGGVLGDMGGFCAGTYKRGLRFLQVPTTVLAQVDASIGGKLGVDFGGVKNSVGLFRDPAAVFIDPAFIETLPRREQRSGLAEILKHSLIADPEQWAGLAGLASVGDADWARLVPSSLRVKERIVRADPLEQGPRKSLNFGHTIGHGIEGVALETDRPLLHGEAIAIGMVAESWLSHRWLGLPAAHLQAISEVILRLYGHHPLAPDTFDAILERMRNDKKNTARGINFSLITEIGKAQVDCFGPDADIRPALDYYNRLGGA